MKFSSTVALPGCVVTCPECHARIGTITKALYNGWEFGVDAIRFEKGQQPVRPPKAQCQLCGASYAELDITIRPDGKRSRQMLIHSDFGWLPRPPPGVNAPPRAPIKEPA